ncbi:hypothetical protein CDL12_26275 [Handroanthus impetiginosus]|uniref:Transcription factor CBF/NF-Y/archaeal histone domain-containing protein n=1 Tax=Handroanthus impetiginosus TaxID=429701 RepID=A0A2G9G7F1_9LAMI|nr:hypothetical protein CDL12_26275 [Handroanthus impetiginosus]
MGNGVARRHKCVVPVNAPQCCPTVNPRSFLTGECPSLVHNASSPQRDREMELGGNSNGGFHGYRRLPRTTSDMKAPEISMGLPPPPQTNHHPSAPTANATTDDNECIVREQDRFMPIANVIRIMRKILPPHAKISDDAKETIQECVSEYISFITSEANDRCQREQRKTITAEDVLWAMSKLGFDDYIEPLTVYLHRYREFDGGDRGSLRGEPLVKRVVDHGPMGFPGFPPAAFHHMAHHHGFFGPAAPMNFFKDQANAGPSQAQVACIEPFPKEQL